MPCTPRRRGPGHRPLLPALGLLLALSACAPGAGAGPSATTTAPASTSATSSAAAASATAVPDTDLPGWRLLLHQDFSTDAALGQFTTVYPGWAGYDGGRDTSRTYGRPTEQQGLYSSATTTTVHDGMLDVEVHTAGATPQVVAITPPVNGSAFVGQLYGRYTLRWQSTLAPGYKLAALLWPESGDWTQGELDFPEGYLGTDVVGFAHDVTGNPAANAWTVRTGRTSDTWHTATIEWVPGKVTYVLDGATWSTTMSSALPTNPMRWVLQIETDTTATAPAADVSGHVYVDALSAWSRTG